MNLIKFGSTRKSDIYNKSASGAYLGIINFILILYPFIFQLLENKNYLSLVFNGIAIMVILILFMSIIKVSKTASSYSSSHLKLLVLTGVLEFFYVVLYCYFLYKKLDVSLFSTDALILFVYFILALTSCLLILNGTFHGYQFIKRTYTRTFRKILASMILVAFWGILMAGILASPLFIFAENFLEVV